MKISEISRQIEDLQRVSENLKHMKEMWNVVSRVQTRIWKGAIDSAIATIKELSAKVASESMERSGRYYNGGWIPCDNISPDDGENVLCTDGSNIYLVEFDIINMDAPYGNIDNIIAWMPLPEAYKEADK